MDYPAATSISAWLLGEHHDSETPFKLTDDHETPTFYQTLAGVTHCKISKLTTTGEQNENNLFQNAVSQWKRKISLSLRKRIGFYMGIPPTDGLMLRRSVHSFLRHCLNPLSPASWMLLTRTGTATLTLRKWHVGFLRLLVVLLWKGKNVRRKCSLSLSLSLKETLWLISFIWKCLVCFKIFDQDKDGLLSRADVFHMVQVMKSVMQENLSEPPSDHVILCLTKEDAVFVDEIFEKVKGESMTLVEYLQFSLSSQLSEQFLTLIYQVSLKMAGFFLLQNYNFITCFCIAVFW